ncbi:hypothetical protein WH52_13230 [Tenacibaculum holothuriorum]|uniref:Glycosyl transferase family 1 n=1 Tax=Tenacibaculum holothuriorum TaxID=1635173 RepID=A0A1Y2P9A3_9FLAO|nr:glycosyltransferase family 4 protein [Tenacibaculum holothuriorum]OSY87022.1 hypothetical protein WH52_13230 [Tenacibaculum holothuriorum]
MKNILFIHQSADLYGSDKTLLFLVESIRDTIKPIVVVPEVGPLTEELKKRNIEVHVLPVIKVSRKLFTSFDIIKLPFQILKAQRILRKKIGDRKIDIIHSNTLAVFLGALYSKRYKIKHIWHVHEIIKSPIIIAKIYPYILKRYSDFIVFNSKASAEHIFSYIPKLKKKSQIIYNGLDRSISFSSKEEQEQIRKNLFKTINESSIIIGLIGRINKHKGQKLLLNAFEELKKQHDNIYLLFIGSTIKTQTFLLDELQNEIKIKNLENHVTTIDFQKQLWPFYDCIDIVLVPTTDPEPFGLVAVEGMLSKKPVIAANHGGLKEIVVNKKTGLLFKPNNISALKASIESLITAKDLIKLYGEEGEKRAKTEFSLNNYVQKFKTLYNSF